LFACGNQESPTASISNVVVDNGEITFEVEYKDPSSIATYYEIEITDHDDYSEIINRNKDLILGGRDEISVDELQKDTVYYIYVRASFVSNRSGHIDEVLAEYTFTTSSWNTPPVFVFVPESVSINEGDSFHLEDIEIIVTDEEDGDLSDQVTLNLADTASLPQGTYYLDLYVQDSNNTHTSAI